MKAFIFNLIKGGIFVFIGYHLILFLAIVFIPQGYIKNIGAVYSNTGFATEKFKDLFAIEKLDILFVGSSITYRGINPIIFEKNGIKAFNIGTSNQTPKNTYFILKEVFKKNLKLEKVILEVSPLTLSSDGVESAVDIISHHPFENKSYVQLITEFKSIKVYNAFFYSFLKFNFGIKNIWEKKSILSSTSGDTYQLNGFVSNLNFSTKFIKDTFSFKFNNIVQYQLEYVDSLKKICKYHNVDFMVISLPNNLYINPVENFNILNKKLNTRYSYINFNELINFDNIYYLDNTHFNRKGADSFSVFLSNYILSD